MKRTVLAFVIAGVLVSIVGTVALRTGTDDEQDRSQPVVMRGPSDEDTLQASRYEGEDLNVTTSEKSTDDDNGNPSSTDHVQAGGKAGGVVERAGFAQAGGRN